MSSSLFQVFSEVHDHRRGQAKQYPLAHILMFCVLGILSGAISYGRMHSFIKKRFSLLSAAFPSKMRKPPSYSQMREILVGLDVHELERAFRKHAAGLTELDADQVVAMDGKVLKGSFDAMDGRNAAQVLSAFIAGEQIILAHVGIAEKSNEIPAMQALIAELGLEGKLYTADAMHCQKKRSRQ